MAFPSRSSQIVREGTPDSHQGKASTPTMGGLIILISLGIASLLWCDLKNPYVWAVLLVTAGYGQVVLSMFAGTVPSNRSPVVSVPDGSNR